MSYNIQGHAASHDHSHLEKIATVIRESRPDLVCLQELHCNTRRVGLHQVEELARLTKMRSAFGRSCEIDGGDYGNAVLTRGEIGEVGIHPLPGGGEPRSILRARVSLDGLSLQVFVTHLTAWGVLRRKERLRQVDALTAVVRERAEFPRIVAGDLNATPRATETRRLLESTPLRSAGPPRGATHPLSRSRLDYILHDDRSRPVSARIVRSGPSDHWPLLAELTLERT